MKTLFLPNRISLIQYFIILCGVLFFSPLQAEVTINKNRVFTTNNTTKLKIDDKDVDANQFLQFSKGMIATLEIGDDVDANVTSGTAKSIHAENQILGPVTNMSPFQVMGQDVVIDADTLLVNNNGTFSEGELLRISGEFTDTNVLLASRIEKVSTLDEFKIITHVSAVNANILQFGHLSLDISNTEVNDCDNVIQPGQLVKFETDFVTNFDISVPLTNITDFECLSGLIILPPGNGSTTTQFTAEGFITEIIDTTHFKLNGQLVETSATTEYVNGSGADIDVGVKLEAEGNFNTTTNLLQANKIEFSQVRVRIIAPVLISELSATQVTALNISGIINALTKDSDSLLPALTQDTQIEIRGFLDSQHNLLIDKLSDKGAPDNSSVRLRGPVDTIATPVFQLLNVTIDTSTSSFILNDSPVDQATFFANLADGAEVDVQNATYNSSIQTLTGGEITLEETADMGGQSPAPSAKAPQPGKGSAKASGNGTIQADGLGALGKGRIFKFEIPSGTLPVAIVAATTLSVEAGSLVTLDASNSTGTSISYLWQQLSGPAVILQNETTATASFTAPKVNTTSTLSFQLTITDNIGNVDVATSTVTVSNTTDTPEPTGGSFGYLLLLLLAIKRLSFSNSNFYALKRPDFSSY